MDATGVNSKDHFAHSTISDEAREDQKGHRIGQVKSRRNPWAWIVPLLLLLAALALPRLDQDGLWYDEIWSLRNAGGAQYGALSPLEIWEQVAFNDPHQAFGYPYLLAAWGAFVGWSEFAGRLLSLFAGLLVVALTYRLGCDLHKSRGMIPPVAPPASQGEDSFPLRSGGSDTGGFSALILGSSAFFLYYTHELRAFTLVALAAVVLLWGYMRLLRGQRLRAGDAVLFIGGGVGLLYTHYFAAATLLGALGLYHLLFVRKNRRWLQITGLALFVGVAFLPELPAFVRGYTRFSPDDVNKIPLSAGEALQSFGHYLGNGAAVLVALLLILGAMRAWRGGGGLRVIVGISGLAVLLTLAANAALGILEPQRLRYTIVLWPGLALWAGAGFALLARWLCAPTRQPWLRRLVLVALPLLWLANALLVYADPAFTLPLHGDRVVRWRTMTNIMQEQGGAADLFAFYAGTATQAYPITSSFEHSVHALPFPAIITSTATDPVSAENRAWAAERIAAAQRLWLGVDRAVPLTDEFDAFREGLRETFVHCQSFVDTSELTLDLYARSPIFCPPTDPTLTYANGIALLQASIGATPPMLPVEMLWHIPYEIPPETYNLALHLTAPGAETLLAQADLPLPRGAVTPLTVTLDLADVPPGEYSLNVIVYDWRTEARLPGTQGETEAERILLGAVVIP